MARVPTYDSPQVQQQVTRPVQLQGVAPDTTSIVRGLESFERGAQILADKQRAETNAAVLQGAATKLGDYQNNDLFNPESGVYATKGGAAIGIAQTRLEAFDKQAVEIRNSLSTDEQRIKWDAYSAGQRQSYSGNLQKYEFKEIDQYKSDQAKGFLSTASQSAVLNYQNPEQINRSLTQIDAVLSSEGQRNGVAPELLEAQKLKVKSSIYADVLQRQATDDPFVAQKRLKEYQGSMSADDLVRVGGMIETKIDRIQQKAEMAQLRAEAKAERTLSKIDAQISSGIPATPEMWNTWASSVRGTPAQAEFNQRVTQEVETQKVLRLPIDQQVSLINEKTAELQQKGGTVADAANLNRLARAVDSSAKMMNNAPLDYFRQRLGGDVQPLDLNSDDAPTILGDRLAAIQGMQQKFGATVAMKPLLPQEARQISAQLEGMSPDDQSNLFARLHAGLGDDKAYAGAMQQIAPDSPVRALTGLIAGKQRSMTLQKKWFSPNVETTSGDVAKTMMVGESILNRSKIQKGEDGSPKSFPLPKQADFQTAFSSAMGDVFAGQPQAYELAMQATKAYYTGAAAQRGDISGEVNSRQMKDAIKASVGEVVDFNGTSTLAPWGMAGDKFEQVARDQLVNTMKAQGMSDQDQALASAFSLRQYKDGVYYVMQGQQFKYGADGKPLMINVNEANQ
ncbi:hypothetical protein [Pseudomonas sp. WS 5071]|uniref:hypothetical protein n=1 Tax=Pseudomonas sp. WS 5071 TaxID=2717479 RepID=UPI001474B960|nr:hypothetical protein [Pseudomonas sp. WS 5071]NMY74186.1 hypothetical protein [Pseudomonas sp. WS 5071]